MKRDLAGDAIVYRFADLLLDPGRREVHRGADRVALSGKTYEVLAALVDAAPDSLATDELMDRVWRGSVVSPATVAKRIELVRQALGDDSSAPRYVEAVRGHGYRLIPKVEIRRRNGRRRHTATIATVAVAAVALTAAFWLLRQPADSPPERTIAVLPFKAVSDDPQDQLFADGLTEELSHALASTAELLVTGRASAFHFRNNTRSPQEIGSLLGVAHVLSGSVRRSGDQIRVTAELVDTEAGFKLWSASYDREMADIIAIQENIARSVASELRATLGASEFFPGTDLSTIDPETYAIYLRAVSLSPYGKLRDLEEAQRLIEVVTERAPGFAPGWNRLAAIHGRRLYGRDPGYEKSARESMSIILRAVARALAINPDSAEAYANLGGAAWVFEGNAAKAAPLIERAVALDPYDLDIVAFAAEFAKFIGRLDEALELERLLVRRDPLCNRCRMRLANSYLYAGRAEDAARQYETLMSLYEGHYRNYGITLLMLDRPSDALESFRKITDFEHLRLQGEAAAFCDLHDEAAAKAALDLLTEKWGQRYPQEVAKAFAYCDQPDVALDYLGQSLPHGTIKLQTEYLSPLYRDLRDEERWQAILERIGRSPEQLEMLPFSLEQARQGLEG